MSSGKWQLEPALHTCSTFCRTWLMALKLSTDGGGSRPRLPAGAPAARRPPNLTVLGRPMLTIGRKPGREQARQAASQATFGTQMVPGHAEG